MLPPLPRKDRSKILGRFFYARIIVFPFGIRIFSHGGHAFIIAPLNCLRLFLASSIETSFMAFGLTKQFTFFRRFCIACLDFSHAFRSRMADICVYGCFYRDIPAIIVFLILSGNGFCLWFCSCRFCRRRKPHSSVPGQGFGAVLSASPGWSYIMSDTLRFFLPFSSRFCCLSVCLVRKWDWGSTSVVIV